MKPFRGITIAAACAMAACGGSGPSGSADPDLANGADDPCGAEAYRQFIGTNDYLSVVDGDDADVRIINPGDAVTKDYRPSRLNLYVDEDGLLTDASCG
ncbi:MAG: I78 family peptidase inhibitor [Pseudomonadota bacterium]